MKKKLVALLATTLLVSATAFAAPTDLVEKTSWDYKAVVGLAQAGIVPVNAEVLTQAPSMTRLDMAKLVAGASRNIKAADTQQKSELLQLVKDFKLELEMILGHEIDIKKMFPVSYGDISVRYMSGPIVNNVRPGNLEGMVHKVGPDVGVAIQKSPEAQAFLTKVKKGLEMKAAGLEVMANKLPEGKQKTALKDETKKLKNMRATEAPILVDYDRNHVEDQIDTRLHLNVFGILKPKTKALARVRADFRWGDTHTSKVIFDRLMVAQRVGDVDVVVGRQGVEIGNGLTYNDYFDGALVSYKKGDTRYTLAHGWPSYFYGQFASSQEDPMSMAYVLHGRDGKLQATFGQISTKIGKDVDAKVYYMKGNNGIPVSAYGFALDYTKGKFWAGGEYAKLVDGDKLPQPFGLLASLLEDHQAYIVGVGYGDFDPEQAGTWNAKLRYLFEGRVAPVMNNYTFNQPFIANYKAWNVNANYTIKKNMYLSLDAFFNGKSVKNTEKYENLYAVSFNYKF